MAVALYNKGLDFMENTALPALTPLLARGLVPDFVLRFCIRRLLAQTLKKHQGSAEAQRAAVMAFVNELKSMPSS